LVIKTSVWIIKSRGLRLAGHIALMGKKISESFFVAKPE
jgi:hypothetical protein